MPLALAVIRKLKSDYSRSLVRLKVLFQPIEPIWTDQPNPFSRDFDQNKMGFVWGLCKEYSEEDFLANIVPVGKEYVAMIFPLNLSQSMINMLEAIGGFTNLFQNRTDLPTDFMEPLNKMDGESDSSFILEFPVVLTFMVQLARLVPEVIPAGAAELSMYPPEAIEMFEKKTVPA